MNAPQFMAYIAFRERATLCRAALADAHACHRNGRLAHLQSTGQHKRLHEEFNRKLDALKEEQMCALDRLGMKIGSLT